MKFPSPESFRAAARVHETTDPTKPERSLENANKPEYRKAESITTPTIEQDEKGHYTLPEPTIINNSDRRIRDIETGAAIGVGGIYEIIDARPPEGVREADIPVLYATGFGSVGKMIPGVLGQIPGEQNRRLVTWNEVVGIDMENSVLFERQANNDSIEGERPEEAAIPTVQLSKALGLIETLRHTQIDKVDVVAHSEGAIHTLLAAALYPEKFRTIVLNSPAGLSGSQSTLSLAVFTIFDRIKQKFDDNKEKDLESYDPSANKMPITVSTKKFNPHNTKTHTRSKKSTFLLDSISQMAKVEMQDVLQYVRSQGVKVAIVHGGTDTAFPATKMVEKITGSPDGNMNQHVEEFVLQPKYGHDTTIRRPDLFKHTVLDTLDRVNTKAHIDNLRKELASYKEELVHRGLTADPDLQAFRQALEKEIELESERYDDLKRGVSAVQLATFIESKYKSPFAYLTNLICFTSNLIPLHMGRLFRYKLL